MLKIIVAGWLGLSCISTFASTYTIDDFMSRVNGVEMNSYVMGFANGLSAEREVNDKGGICVGSREVITYEYIRGLLSYELKNSKLNYKAVYFKDGSLDFLLINTLKNKFPC
jgi:hypothetical protein